MVAIRNTWNSQSLMIPNFQSFFFVPTQEAVQPLRKSDKVIVTYTVIDVLGDATLIVLAIYFYPQKRLRHRCKIAFYGVISLAFSAVMASLIKTLHAAFKTKYKDGYRAEVYTLWSSIELHVGIVAVSLPTIIPILESLFGHTSDRAGNDDQRSLARTVGHGSRVQMTSISQYSMNRLGLENEHLSRPEHNRSSIVGRRAETLPGRSAGALGCEYKVEVSAPRPSTFSNSLCPVIGEMKDSISGNRNGSHRDNNGTGIMRTTDVYVRMDTPQQEER
ncbi:hypothetical protein FQN57_001685 [Myotisia sp. PD_48]|nr:hypothetical protein FQN57_001685 [Myotisia sp. PD_48]